MTSIDRLRDLFELTEAGALKRRVRRKGSNGDGSVGHMRKDGYIRVCVDGKHLFAHRIVFALANGFWADQVDHVNCVRSDNRPENLRQCLPFENQANMRISSRNSSGYKGVSWASSVGKWYACIQIKGKSKNLGYHQSKEDAADAYLAAAQSAFGEFARAR